VSFLLFPCFSQSWPLSRYYPEDSHLSC
jgi:hypothetical protein